MNVIIILLSMFFTLTCLVIFIVEGLAPMLTGAIIGVLCVAFFLWDRFERPKHIRTIVEIYSTRGL